MGDRWGGGKGNDLRLEWIGAKMEVRRGIK